MNLFSKIFYTAQLLLLNAFAKAQYSNFAAIPHNNPLQTDIDSTVHVLADTFFKKATAPGLVIGIIHEGERHFYQYGYADKASQRPFTTNTLLEAGSITKTFVANLLFQLQKQGYVNSHDAITKYLPDSVSKEQLDLQKITLAQLANHTSGLPRLPDNIDKVPGFAMEQPYQHYAPEHLYAYLQKAGIKKAGSYDYSNLGFGLLGTLLANNRNASLGELMQEYIFKPLQMTNSSFNGANGGKDSATGYLNGKPTPYWRFNALAGAGAVKTTVADMLTYLQAHLLPTGDITFDNTVKTITQKTAAAGPKVDIGYGWHIFNNLKNPLYWHNGGTYAFSTFAAFDPKTQSACFLAANAFNNNKGLDKMGVDLSIYLSQ
jgi:CubicO group peptidase (beta-lactamase class C family)